MSLLFKVSAFAFFLIYVIKEQFLMDIFLMTFWFYKNYISKHFTIFFDLKTNIQT